MKKFARHKSHDEIRRQCRMQRLHFMDTKYRLHGSDFVTVSGGGADVFYNVASGWFFGTTPAGVEFSSNDTKHDSKPWMQALLQFFYSEAA